MATKKMGRPTESPKDYMLRVRMDAETLRKLDECCKVEGLSRSEVVRQGIQDRYGKIKK
ncbi:MAG: ribbon-helix-helix domain-containing protein [Clostridiales bacterium]|nr:ribbon-helix-helix domain-containing protein [Clostridiales bacterium]MDY4172959.1 ribbon-helix-helix domain-containing protein [Evtepia sp.]